MKRSPREAPRRAPFYDQQFLLLSIRLPQSLTDPDCHAARFDAQEATATRRDATRYDYNYYYH
eukprot:3707664-Karenia_brevis.AAC.1